MPLSVTRRLNLSIKKSKIEKYVTAEPVIRVRRIANAVKIYLKVGDRKINPIVVDDIKVRWGSFE